MSRYDRRQFLTTVGASALGGAIAIRSANSSAQTLSFKPEAGAKLRVLRWKRFVQGDEDMWIANTKKFSELSGVPVTIDNENWEDLRPKAAVAANVGTGPDIVLPTNDDPHQYPDKLLDLNDLCDYLGAKYGGWYDTAITYGKSGNRWIAMPLGCGGNAMVYRESHLRAAGFQEFPRDTNGLLQLCQALKAKGTPAGFALGNATGDANGWCHWLLWAFGGKLVDERGKVGIVSRETAAMLEYAKQIYPTMAPGTLSWLDPNNNKAFLAGEISLTNNGISIYYTAKNSAEPNVKSMAADIQHAYFPVGPIARPTESRLFWTCIIFKYTKYPNAAKEYLRFMMEKEQYDPWQRAAIGFVSQPLKAYENNPVWTDDPKHAAFRDGCRRMLPNGWPGPLGAPSAGAMADFIVVNMVAKAASGQATIDEAMKEAERRARRYYRT